VNIIKVEKVNLVDEVYRQILQQILSGNWKEGEKIASENQLTQSFAVSRVVIREALQRLRSEKYIITKQGIGSFVTNPNNYGEPDVHIDLSEGMYEQMIQFRRAIEYPSVELASVNATEEDFERLRSCLSKMKETADDLESFSTADFDFHYSVVLCSHNELFEKAMLANKKLIIQILKEMNRVPKSQSFAVDSHQQITEAICTRNVSQALKQYEKNNNYNMVRLTEFYEKRNSQN
jgi:DNA-binding FadR family transcriptional regulator